MSKLSISFTLGKASAGKANIEHNNREFVSSNVDVTRMADNVTYIRQDIRETYEELFGDALVEYNAKQTRKDRKIHDYYEHIAEDKRRETHYEIVVQFGDSHNTAVGSENGKLAVKMLDKYMREFQARNPRLHIVNSVLHADESSPHLHIDFIPFYTQGKEKGLSQGVSLRAALEEQGFTNQNKKLNGMVAWENSEMKALESILNNHDVERDVKGVKHKNMPVPEYKASQDWRKLPKRKKNMSPREVIIHQLEKSETENSRLKVENDRLTIERNSPYRSFFYSDADKQNFVQSKLDELSIPYRESENGIEAKACYVEQIRNIEKQYVSKPKSHREMLRETLDKVIMQSKDFDEVLNRLKGEGYSVKRGKYIAVQPSNYDNGFIRLKSLGEDYSEQAINNRLINKQRFEQEIDSLINAEKNQELLKVRVFKSVRHFTIVFAKGYFPVRKTNKEKPFEWTNCAELDKLSELNKKINAGVTLTSLQNELTRLDTKISDKEKRIEQVKAEKDFYSDLYDRALRWYSTDVKKNYADLPLLEKHSLTRDDYGRLKEVVADKDRAITQIEQSISEIRAEQKDISETLSMLEKVVSGTYIQSLFHDEKQRQQSNVIGNGVKLADGSNSEQVDRIMEKVVDAVEKKIEEPIVQYQPPKPPRRG